MKLNNVEIGIRIRECRKKLNMSQEDLAQKSNIDKTSLSRYENGKQTPNLSTLTFLACVLETSLDYLALGKTSKIKIQKETTTNEELIFKSLAILMEEGVLLYEPNYTDKYFMISESYQSYKSFVEKFEKLKEFNGLIGKNYEDAKEQLILSFSQELVLAKSLPF